MLSNFIWAYINDCYDLDGVLPDADSIYLKFQLEFDHGADLNIIDSVMEGFIRTHDLEGIEILWEGEIYARSVEAY